MKQSKFLTLEAMFYRKREAASRPSPTRPSAEPDPPSPPPELKPQVMEQRLLIDRVNARHAVRTTFRV
jgi:hypothetical protein